MKSQPKQKFTKTLGELRAALLAAVAEIDLKGTDSKVTRAMCIIEATFDTAFHQKRIVPREAFLSGMAKARIVERNRNFMLLIESATQSSNDLLEVAAFEADTCLYRPENYKWEWNEKDNLEGYEVFSDKTEIHRFTWQPHGSQFTIIEDVPTDRLAIKIRKPPELDKEAILKTLEFDASWVQIIK